MGLLFGSGTELLVGAEIGLLVGSSTGLLVGRIVGIGVGFEQISSSVAVQIDSEALQLVAPQQENGVEVGQVIHDEVPLKSFAPSQSVQSKDPVPA